MTLIPTSTDHQPRDIENLIEDLAHAEFLLSDADEPEEALECVRTALAGLRGNLAHYRGNGFEVLFPGTTPQLPVGVRDAGPGGAHWRFSVETYLREQSNGGTLAERWALLQEVAANGSAITPRGDTLFSDHPDWLAHQLEGHEHRAPHLGWSGRSKQRR